MAEKKKRENVVEKFFSKKKVLNDAGKELSVTWCLLCGDAGKPFKCVTTYNLLRHLLLKHKKEAADAGVVCNEENEEVIDGDVPVKPSRVHIVLDRNLYISSIVRWITDGSVSLNFFSKKYVSDVLGAIESGLKLGQTSRKNVVPYISAVEARMVNFITHQMQGKYICVKADLASRKGRTVLSINSQYVLRGKIVVRTLAMVERIDKNTAENIYADIVKVLNKFGVDLKQVYSITTDNGKNFLKAANIMRKAQQEELNSSEMDYEVVENGTSEGEDEGFLPAEEQPSISEDDAPEDISDDSEYLNFSNDQNSFFEEVPEDDLPVIDQPHLTGVKCAAHVIQLSVYDVIKKKPVAKFLAKVRKLVKILKTQPYATHYKLDKTRNVPILDGETRWGSAHRMVARMCDQKKFVQGLLPADLQRSPSVIHEKKKMLDITRDKPIKIAVRVQVPVRDHPKFNFVGKLLGPKGNSLKRLQEETMCKMAVLGKGSMRDRKKEEELRLSGDPRYAHLSEDLHVEISTYTAPAEAHARIAYALAEVRRFLVPDYHDDIRQEQMWEMQALNSAQNASNGTNGNCNGTTTINGHNVGGTNLGNGTTHGNVTLNGNGLNGGNPEMMHHQSCGVDSITSNGTSTNSNSGVGGGSNGNNGCGGVLTGSDGTSNHSSQHSTSHHHHHQQHHQHQHHQQQQQQQFLSSSASVAAVADAAVAAAATVTDMSNLMPVDVNMTSANHFVNSLPTTDIEAQTLAFVESANAFLHPALRGVKTVSLAARKRPLLGGPRSSMNPTKRTVMTLIARARTAQAMHGSRTTAPMGEPIQVITSPLILQPSLDLLQSNGTGSVQKENILQGA